MRLLHPLSVSAAGVHIVDGYVRWVCIDGSVKAPRLRAVDAEPTGDDEQAALEAIVARQRARGTATAVHVDAVFVRHLVARGALPEDSNAHHDWLLSELHRAGIAGDPTDLAVHARALTSPLDPEEASPHSGESGGTALDLASQVAVTDRQALLLKAGLVPAAVVSPWAAVAQFIEEGTALVVEPGEVTVVSAHDGVVAGLTSGYSTATSEAGRGDSVNVVVGAGGEDPETPDELSGSPDVSTSGYLRTTPAGIPLRGSELPPGFGLAAVLALVAMEPERSASFLGPAGAQAGRAAQARGRAASVLLSGVFVLAVPLLMAAGWKVSAARDAAAVRAELLAADDRVFELRDAERDLAQASRPKAQAPNRPGPASSMILYDLASALPDDVWLDRLAYRADVSSVDIEGKATDDEAVAQLLDRLDAASSFGSARLDESGALVSPDGFEPASLRRFRMSTGIGGHSRSGSDETSAL